MAKWTGPDWLRPQQPDEETAYCNGVNCQCPIVWRKHPETGRKHPVDPEGGSHFATCRDAGTFRRDATPAQEDRQGDLWNEGA